MPSCSGPSKPFQGLPCLTAVSPTAAILQQAHAGGGPLRGGLEPDASPQTEGPAAGAEGVPGTGAAPSCLWKSGFFLFPYPHHQVLLKAVHSDLFFWPLPPVWKGEPQGKFQKAFSSLSAVKRPGPSSYPQASLLEESPWALTHYFVRKLQPRGKESS